MEDPAHAIFFQPAKEKIHIRSKGQSFTGTVTVTVMGALIFDYSGVTMITLRLTLRASKLA
jgi:hypothetical protein